VPKTRARYLRKTRKGGPFVLVAGREDGADTTSPTLGPHDRNSIHGARLDASGRAPGVEDRAGGVSLPALDAEWPGDDRVRRPSLEWTVDTRAGPSPSRPATMRQV
jgi:hypothetical protein